MDVSYQWIFEILPLVYDFILKMLEANVLKQSLAYLGSKCKARSTLSKNKMKIKLVSLASRVLETSWLRKTVTSPVF